MSTTHTPGPWKVNFTRFSQVIAENGALVATCNRLGSLTGLEANARLISAAPDLLEELTRRMKDRRQELFENWLSATSPSGDVEQVHAQWERSSEYGCFLAEWGSALDVIDKATGAQS